MVVDNSGAVEIVQHKVTGYVARSFDPVDLANGIGWLLADRQRHAEIARNAAKDARRRFSPVTAARKYLISIGRNLVFYQTGGPGELNESLEPLDLTV